MLGRTILLPLKIWQTITLEKGEVLDLIKISLEELGLTGERRFTDQEICSQALAQGFKLCPLETVDLLCEKCRNQENRECLRIASEIKIDSSIDYAYIFAHYVGKGTEPPKGSRNTRRSDDYIIFVQPRD